MCADLGRMTARRFSFARLVSCALAAALSSAVGCAATSPSEAQATDTSALADRVLTKEDWPACRWSFDSTGITEAHKTIAKPGDGVTIAQIDTGYLPSPHFDLGSTVERGVWLPPVAIGRPYPSLNAYETTSWDPLDQPIDDPMTNWGHGATTAGMIVNRASSILPVSGIAPYAKLIPYRIAPSVIVGNQGGGALGSVQGMARAIRNATSLDVDIINISMGALIDTSGPRVTGGVLGFPGGDSNELEEAINAAFDAGIIVNAAAGHGVPSYLDFLHFFPASALPRGANAVAASQPGNSPWGSTIASKHVTVSAPGAEICYVRPRVESWTPGVLSEAALQEIKAQFVVKKGSGTSFATAYVSGMAAIWLGEMKRSYPSVAKKKIAAAFKALLAGPGVTVPTGWKRDQYGSGVINLTNLMKSPPNF